MHLLSLKFHWTLKVIFFIKDAQGNFRNVCKIIQLEDEASSFVCWHRHARGKVTKNRTAPAVKPTDSTAWERSLKRAVNPLQQCQAISPCWSSGTKTLPPGPADTSTASWMTPELICSHAISSSLHPCFAFIQAQKKSGKRRISSHTICATRIRKLGINFFLSF